MSNYPTVKILVGYHKPAALIKNDIFEHTHTHAALIKNDIFEPIHLGRALATENSKDGKMSQEDYQWMLDNMIGDDTGDNISTLNRTFAELTGIYWAWKNYDKLGNPDYIGFCHYRRYFNEELVLDCINEGADIIAPEPSHHKETVKEQFSQWHEEKHFNIMDSVLKAYENYEQVVEFFAGNKQHFCNLFVMKKEIFMNYCQWLFDVVNKIDKLIDYETITAYNQRLPAFSAERCTSFYIEHLKKKKNVKEIPCIFDDSDKNSKFPLANKNPEHIPIILASDDNYINFVTVCITSVMENADKALNYNFYIIGEGLNQESKNKLRIIEQQYSNLKIMPIKTSSLAHSLIENIHFQSLIGKNLSFTHSAYNLTTYYRLFIDKIFKNFKKVIYLDSDSIVLEDISKLYNTDLENHVIGATRDIYVKAWRHFDKNFNNYVSNVLKLDDDKDYFQAGILLIDVEKFVQNNIGEKLFAKLNEIKSLRIADQCILNSTLNKDVCYIDSRWDYDCNLVELNKTNPLIQNLSNYYMELMEKAKNSPYIVHYAGPIKPWEYPEMELAHLWWKYARMTPFYEEIIYNNIRDIAPKNKIFWRYKILSKIIFRKIRGKYKRKKKELKVRLRAVSQFLKGK